VEDAPVQILAPDDGIFHYPNKITAKDFDGWVQERGLYFMESWDDHFKPLLACNDPESHRKKADCCGRSTAREPTSSRAMRFSGSFPQGFPGPSVFMSTS